MHVFRSRKSGLIDLARVLACGLAFTTILFSFSPSALAQVQRYRLKPEESRIVSKIKDPFGNIVSGSLRLREGQAGGDPERLRETGTVILVLDATSYDSDLGLRDKDVQEDYLEVRQYPSIRFASTSIVQVERSAPSGEGGSVLLRGTLTFHGVKKEITVPVALHYDGKRIVAEGRLQILLENFNIAAPSLLFLKAGNQVDVEFTIVGERSRFISEVR